MSDSPHARVVGRDTELSRLGAAIEDAAAARATSVIVTGDHGIGKTAVCLAATDPAQRPATHRLVVSCPPLRTLASGLTPLRTALRRTTVSPALTRTCLARMDEGDPVRAIEDWVEDVVAHATLVVVVDDLQWADSTLRDLVAYLLAGPAERRLAVLVTACTAELPVGHPLHDWLADVVRMPGVGVLEIGRLPRDAIETQLADLLGSRPHQSLVDEIYLAGGGNPYLTQLLAQGLPATARHLPEEHPADLVAAVMGHWHRCSRPTRALVCLLAVTGPLPTSMLGDAAAELGWPTDIAASLAEAEAAGLLAATGERNWFRHPLQATIIERPIAAEDRRAWHLVLARLGDRAAEGATPTLETAIAQAQRHDQAGSPADAYHWAMRAWQLRGGANTPELRQVLRRAVDLRDRAPDATETIAELWQRLRLLAAEAGALAAELEAVEALLAAADPQRQPLEAAELMVRRMLVRSSLAIEFFSMEQMEQAVALAAGHPDSWQLAYAEAEVAHVATWRQDPRAAEFAERALTRARSAGHPGALSHALTAAAIVALNADRAEEARRLAGEGLAAAAAARDWWAFVHAVMWESNALPDGWGWGDAAYLSHRRAELAALGGPLPYVLQIGAVEAEVKLELGDWESCQRLLREVLVADPAPFADLRCRLCLALLAAYQGRPAEALAHVARARELIAERQVFANVSLEATWATALLEAGRPAEAYAVAVAAAGVAGFPVDRSERLMPLAARALADQAVAARDRRGDDGEILAAVADLRQRFPTVIDAEPASGLLRPRRVAAMQAWYEAETARARGEDDEPTLWVATRDRCETGELPWLDAYACWRAADALLGRGATGRAEGARQLRAGYDLARRLGAESLRLSLESLARLAHLPLVAAEAHPSRGAAELPGLTPREREILDLLCHGLTYADIARTLVISEKTVSSHVSNLLRKTGTASRVELTRLADRVAHAAEI